LGCVCVVRSFDVNVLAGCLLVLVGVVWVVLGVVSGGVGGGALVGSLLAACLWFVSGVVLLVRGRLRRGFSKSSS